MQPPPERTAPDAENAPPTGPGPERTLGQEAAGGAAPGSTPPAEGSSVPGPRTGAARAGRVTLRSDLRASWPDGLVALAITAALSALIWARINSRASSTATVMPFMADDPEAFLLYFLSQAFGWSALLWAWITVVLGLLLSGPRPARLPLSGPRLERLHRTTSLNTIALIAAHALLFAAELIRHNNNDAWYGAAWTAFVETFVPGGYDSGTGRIAIPVGQAALYLAIPLGLLFYIRHRIGPKTWRVLHRFVLVVYVLSVWHTLLYGTNVWYDGWFRTSVWLLQLPIAALFLARLLSPARRSERLPALAAVPGGGKPLWTARAAGRAAAAAVLVVLVAILVTGRDGGREEPPADTTSTHNHD
ncbi:ferric reductase-like transmembrane domain-containing protein [Streptomyces tsukubensis]|uniref:ferric reductase-like transmembrane domain-containing protein n=1 Tax=Streptomyces tsukubensis TaxID=83656 RepID=UPI0036A67725